MSKIKMWWSWMGHFWKWVYWSFSLCWTTVYLNKWPNHFHRSLFLCSSLYPTLSHWVSLFRIICRLLIAYLSCSFIHGCRRFLSIAMLYVTTSGNLHGVSSLVSVCVCCRWHNMSILCSPFLIATIWTKCC